MILFAFLPGMRDWLSPLGGVNGSLNDSLAYITQSDEKLKSYRGAQERCAAMHKMQISKKHLFPGSFTARFNKT